MISIPQNPDITVPSPPLQEIMRWPQVKTISITMNTIVNPDEFHLSSRLPTLTVDQLKESAWIMARYLERFAHLHYMTACEPKRLSDEIQYTIDRCNRQLFDSGLHTFGIVGAIYKSRCEVLFDIETISEDPFREIEDRTMCSIFFWKQRDEFYRYLLGNIQLIPD